VSRPGGARDAVRLAVGTLTVVPVRPPGTVDRRTAGWAMVLAPVVGLGLAVAALAVVWALGGGSLLVRDRGAEVVVNAELAVGTRVSQLSPLLAAVLVVSVLALLTRGLHLDGLADTADGLGSGASRERALEVMRSGDVGPFGVVTLLLVLLVQVACLARLLGSSYGTVTVVGAVVLGRLALPVLCSVGVPAARREGLGSTVAGSVPRVLLVLSAGLGLVSVLVAWAAVELLPLDLPGGGPALAHVLAAVVVPAAVTGLLVRRCVRRFGGVTGDVLGAAVEVTFTVALLVAAL